MEAIRHFALDAQDADELAAHEERHAQLALGIRQARQRNAARGTLGMLRLAVHRQRVEHAAHQAGDADRLARFGNHAADALAEADFGPGAVLAVAARGNRDQHVLLLGRHEEHRVTEAERLVEREQDRIDERLEAVGAVNAFAERLQRVDREDRAGGRRCRGVRVGLQGARSPRPPARRSATS